MNVASAHGKLGLFAIEGPPKNINAPFIPDGKSNSSRSSTWGRKTTASTESTLACTLGVLGCPIWVTVYWIALEHCGGSLSSALKLILSAIQRGQIQLLLPLLPKPAWSSAIIYITWVIFQALLFHLLPGRTSYGQRTPGGNLLRYTTNGLTAWALTHALFFIAVHQEWIDKSVVAKHWQGLFVAANAYGYFLAGSMYIKAHLWPTFAEDCKFSGSSVHDFWMGIELNPRIGSFDLKLFHNGRPGIVAWSLIDISFAAYQYEVHGHISNSMLVVITLHALYVLDFYANEDWYLRTIDIAHDHFGMMLSWGDAVFLPTFYTLQAQYLARYPVELTSIQTVLILALGLLGYYGFRAANEQKDHVRQMDGKAIIWNRPATFIRCQYSTLDGKDHSTVLLTSGWWGMCRHANYTADLLMAFAMCAACSGRGQLLPWSYFLYLSILLINRTWRDEHRCAAKYGKKWDEYCRAVPWRLIPGVY